MPNPAEPRMPSPQSVTRVIRILEALCTGPGTATLADLSRQLGTPKTSLAALLRGLADIGFVIAADGGYRLGPGAFGLGSALQAARRSVQSSDLVREGMRRLALRSGETILFAVRDGDGGTITYVDVIESHKAVRFSVSVGDRRPLFSTASGRVLLAAGPEDGWRQYLRQLKPEPLTPHTDIDKKRLAAIVEAARDTGVAQTIDQTADGVTGTAAVIRDASDAAIGALVVAAPSSRSQDRLDELARLVADEAATISRSLGQWTPPRP